MKLDKDKRFPHLCPGRCDCAVCGWLQRRDDERAYWAATREEYDAAVAARDLRQ